MKKVSAVVCAAGLSRRMGAVNKLLLPYGDSCVLGRCLAEITAAPIDEVVVVTGHDAARVTQAASAYAVRVVYHAGYAAGMTGSVQKGVAAAAEGHDVMVCLADQVGLDAGHLRRLLARWQIAPIDALMRPTGPGGPGHPVLFAACYRPEILGLPPGEGCREVTVRHADKLIEVWDASPAWTTDVDTPEAYKRVSGNASPDLA